MRKTHWSHLDSFDGVEGEYIKSLVHYDYEIGFHTHSFYELNIILSGRGEHLIEGMRCDVLRGCVFVIPPNVKHSYKNYGELNVYHMLIHRDFFPMCFSEFLKTMGFSLLFEIEPYVRAQYCENMFLTLSESGLDLVLRDIELIQSYQKEQDGNLYINAVAKKILVFLCMEIVRQSGVGEVCLKTKNGLLSIADSLKYIHLNYEERITIDILAKQQHMSRATYIRRFTKICGCSPHQYLMQYRLKKAEEALMSQGASVTEIAQHCGFYDASHLRKYLNKKE